MTYNRLHLAENSESTTMDHLTTGNSAKVYCLQQIENYIQHHAGPVRILDLGSGTSGNFVNLLKKYPETIYVGIEPSPEACEQARKLLDGTHAQIINDYAYHIMGRLIQEPFDIIVSFSVMEHVYRRQLYLESAAACMHENSLFLMNYDAGHFVNPQGLKERLKNLIGPVLARLGVERYYQSFVHEAEFQSLVQSAGLRIEQAYFFNSSLKGIHKLVPTENQDEHLTRWLEYELWLNAAGITYKDEWAAFWRTRNYMLRKR